VGTVQSIRHDLRAEPFGFRTNGTVARDVVIGYGSALAAPWPLVTTLWASLYRFGRRGTDRFDHT
jgi:hypothetical protein